jgi:putative selenate reductase
VAVGQRTRADFLPEGGLKADPATYRTSLEGIFAGGDALRGASSLVEAIGDGRKAALAILQACGLQPTFPLALEDVRKPDFTELRIKQARRILGPQVRHRSGVERLDFELDTEPLTEAQAREEASRCLQCDLFCNICVTVCPNRANVALPSDPVTYPLLHLRRDEGDTRVSRVGTVTVRQPFQVVNIADFCNECGNCETFCPTAGAPYRDKYKVHLHRESFEAYGTGVYFTSASRMEAVIDEKSAVFDTNEKGMTYEDDEIRLVFDSVSFDVKEVFWEGNEVEKDIRPISELAVLYQLLKEWMAGIWKTERER